jgi:hypothetical protein
VGVARHLNRRISYPGFVEDLRSYLVCDPESISCFVLA